MFKNEEYLLKILQLKNNKIFLILGTSLILILFGDTILLFIGHCLHVMFEFIASLIEHWLQTGFNLTERQAQIVFFYLFITITGCIAWRLSKKVYKKTKQVCISAHCRARQRVESLNWLRLAFLLAVFGTSVLLLT